LDRDDEGAAASDASVLDGPPVQGDGAQVRLGDALRALGRAERELSLARQREASLDRELQHRIRNILALTRSIFSRTVESHESLEQLASHFHGRLDALARHQAGSLRTSQRKLSIEDMVRTELLGGIAEADSRVTIRGPEVLMEARQAEPFGMALHELVTNSIKFGVLSQAETKGQLTIGWQRAGDRLIFEWRESGVAVIGVAPLRHGFGREYIEQSLPFQLDARTCFELGAGTVHCTIDLPMMQPGEQN
jgi:two-component system CheB/CheR fusion protein